VCRNSTGYRQKANERMNNYNQQQKKEIKTMLERIIEIAAESLGIEADTLSATTSFKEDLQVDSLDLFEMVMALEEEYNIEIPTEKLEEMKTIGDIVAYIEKA
jgi:acyl carrier protein